MTPAEQQAFKTAVIFWLKELVDNEIEKRRHNGHGQTSGKEVRGADSVQ
jgi:hypothetical protein